MVIDSRCSNHDVQEAKKDSAASIVTQVAGTYFMLILRDLNSDKEFCRLHMITIIDFVLIDCSDAGNMGSQVTEA